MDAWMLKNASRDFDSLCLQRGSSHFDSPLDRMKGNESETQGWEDEGWEVKDASVNGESNKYLRKKNLF